MKKISKIISTTMLVGMAFLMTDYSEARKSMKTSSSKSVSESQSESQNEKDKFL